MHVLITGGAGFIGANLVRYWLAAHPDDVVVAMDRLAYGTRPENLIGCVEHDRLRFVRGDVADEPTVLNVFSEHPIEGVVHAAAQSHVDRSISDPAATLRDNVLATFTLLEAFRRHAVGARRFHHVSTDEVYGQLGEDGVFHENSPYRPDNPYSATKAASDHLVRAYAHTYGIRATVTHCSNNYGPYQFPDKFIPRMIRRAFARQPLPVYGDGSNVRDWLHVEDHCRAIDRIFQSAPGGETYCVGSNNEWRNIDLVNALCRLIDERTNADAGTHARLITFVPDRPGHDFRYALDASKLRSDLGWEPRVAFDSGLASTLDWYLANTDWIERVLPQRDDNA